MAKYKELSCVELRKICDPKSIKIKTAAEGKLPERIIDQERAARAIDFGLKVKGKGYNIFASGIPGTGRSTAISSAIEKIASKQPIPDDWCYVYNFDSPDEPKAIRLKAGLGEKLKKDMDELVKELKTCIHKSFESKDYEEQKNSIINKFQEKRDLLVADLERKAQEKGFELKQTSTGLISIPLYKGKPVNPEKFDGLSDKEREAIEKNREALQLEMVEALRKIRGFEKEAKQQMRRLDKHIALFAVEHLIDEVKMKYKEYADIRNHLQAVQEDILENIDSFREKETPQLPIPGFNVPHRKKLFIKYRVNVLVNNKETKGAPFIKETNPTYYNLIGRIEYRPHLGSMTTDFTMIKSGTIHRASGGYLIIQALDVLKNFMAWESLKGIIKTGQVKIEDINEQFRVISTVTLKPQPIPVNVKVIMIGHPMIYHLLYKFDEDFHKLFKIKADFGMLMNRNETQVDNYAYFIAVRCQQDNLLPFTADAIARVVEYGSRLVEDQEKLSARFLDIADILCEANYWAESDNSKEITSEYVVKAIEEKRYRSDMIEERIRELIKEGTLLVDVKDKVAGQINGISIVDLGDYSFGLPSRITARTYMGQKGLVDIQREAKLSGKIHSKGIMIICGYLGEKFSQDKPLSFSASLSFEQTYSEIDGDSASSAEIYVLLSSLSGLPIDQGIAVTGSVDQKGIIQPIGGVNEKIEGFYYVCKQKGLTGNQGVIIPELNVRNLMLKEEIVEAVKNKKFHIYPVSTIEEGIEILTGKPAGARKKDGSYPQDTILGLADKRLTDLTLGWLKFSKNAGSKSKKKK